MSPIVFIVFAPVVFGMLAFTGLFFGAAFAGVWEGVEERTRETLPASGSTASPASPDAEAYSRAA